jgi:hypothetical protein
MVPGMETLLTLLVCYLGLGALTCATPRGVDDFSPQGQWALFRATFADVVAWPAALWRDFGSA